MLHHAGTNGCFLVHLGKCLNLIITRKGDIEFTESCMVRGDTDLQEDKPLHVEWYVTVQAERAGCLWAVKVTSFT